MTTDTRPWNACERCGRLILHFDQWFEETCEIPGKHELAVEHWIKLPFGTAEPLKKEKQA